MNVFWNVAQRVIRATIETVSTPETTVNLYETKRGNVSEDRNLQYGECSDPQIISATKT